MKIYISGKVSGLDYADVRRTFQEAQDMLENLNFEVVNPLKNGLNHTHTWEEHIARDIELLLPCDAIYMLANWTDSVGSGIEHSIAVRMNKAIVFERTFTDVHQYMSRLQSAIHEATGLMFCDYTNQSRNKTAFYSRMIFAYNCIKEHVDIKYLAGFINRDRTTIIYYVNKYDTELRYNREFADFVDKVNNNLANI